MIRKEISTKLTSISEVPAPDSERPASSTPPDLDPPVPDDEHSGAAALRTLCPARHDLQRFEVPWSGDFTCDRCLRDIPLGEVMWSCRCCSYDICDACSCEGYCSELHGMKACSSGCHRRPRQTASWDSSIKASLDGQHSSGGQRLAYYHFDTRPGSPADEADIAPPQLRWFVQAVWERLAMTAERERGPCGRRGDREDAEAGPPEVSQEWALRTVNATAAEVSRLMTKVHRVPREEKKALIAQAALLETSREYTVALERLRRDPPPRAAEIDPLGGTTVQRR